MPAIASSLPADLRVVLFSGGRGSGALAELLGTDPRIELTIAINGYDDGASTGEVRRFLGDALGPSDFRKNAARLARLRASCPPSLIELLDRRLPRAEGEAAFESLSGALDEGRVGGDGAPLDPALAQAVASRLRRFDEERRASGRPFDFSDCSVGNLVFAGSYLLRQRRFNAAVDDYSSLLGLRPGLIDNVTDGTNAFLVALDSDLRLLASEEAIVDAKRRNRIDDIFLVRERPDGPTAEGADGLRPDSIRARLEALRAEPPVNPRLVGRLSRAHLIIYAPGTQHSSLFPSYLTPGLGEAIASNLEAIKLLVTNLQTDAEIAGSTAVDLVERALFYLREKGRLQTPGPCLITHYLLNDPGRVEPATPYVPLGRLESLEDPRLVRVGNYEQGRTGRHDATKILGPFVDTFIARSHGVQKVAVVLQEACSPGKIAQTLLEMVRGGIKDQPALITVFHEADTDLEPAFVARLPFPVRRVTGTPHAHDAALRAVLVEEHFDYVLMFDSSGMYNGEDIAGLVGHLRLGRLDAVWGSRRLSVRDIHESYRVKYRRRRVLGSISYVGSHVLSLLYLLLYGRYISDTLSAARAVRVDDALTVPGLLTHKMANHHLLTALLRRRAEVLEIPVQFFSISPARVHRTTVLDGLQAIVTVLAGRFSRTSPGPAVQPHTERSDPSRAWTGS